jgi:hypothetical protein
MSRTKKLKLTWIIAAAISTLLTLFPLVFFSIKAFMTTGLVESKMALCGSLMIVLILTAVCKLKEYKPRSLLWIVLIALWLALDSLGAIIITFTITQCLDEFLVCPVKNYAKWKYSINKEIDKR